MSGVISEIRSANSKSRRKALKEGSGASNVVWFGDDGTDQKTLDRTGVAELKMSDRMFF